MTFSFIVGRTAYFVHTKVGAGSAAVVVQEKPLDPPPASELEPSGDEA